MGGFTQWSWVKWYQTAIRSDGTTLGMAIEADPKNPREHFFLLFHGENHFLVSGHVTL
jgi:hypothetical protein